MTDTEPGMQQKLTAEALNDQALGVGADYLDDKDEIPECFIQGCNTAQEARRRWQATKKWRSDYHVDAILEEPQPNFAKIKELYPHGLILRGKSGHWIYVERPGKAKLSEVWKSGMTMESLERHYTFITEYLWRKVDPRVEGKLVSIFDADGCALSDLAGDTLKMFQKCSGLLGAHYPERSYKIFITNAPMWMKVAWNIISPFLDPNTCRKIRIIKKGADMMKELKDYCDREDLPTCIGGTSPIPFGSSPVELEMLEHILSVNQRSAAKEELPKARSVASGAEEGVGRPLPNVHISDKTPNEIRNNDRSPEAKRVSLEEEKVLAA